MKKVYIIGTGGFAAELTEYILDNNRYEDEISILGYFDLNDENHKLYNFEAPFLGKEKEYNFPKNSILYLAIGDNIIRKNVIDYFKDKHVMFDNFVHHSCLLASSSILGKGNILCPHVIIGPKTILGDHNLLNYKTAIPHDCKIGTENVFSPNINITGYTTIGNNNFFGISCNTLPNINIGNNNKIQAGITVGKSITNNNIVFAMNKIKTMVLYNEK